MPGYHFRPLVRVISVCLAGGVLQANVIVSTSLSLTQLSLTPQSGLLHFLPAQDNPLSPPECTSAHLCATAFAQALDSLGGFDQHFKDADNSTANANALTALASAASTGSAPGMTASSVSGVTILGFDASASSVGQGSPASLLGAFQITGTSTATAINVSATFSSTQSLTTDFFGISASSETILTVQIGDDFPVFFDSPLSIGPNTTLILPVTQTLNGSTTALFQPNTSYSIFIQTDAESSGLNSPSPEPSSLYVLITVLGISSTIAVSRARRSKSRASVSRLP
jgi:hypothetical protein